MRQEHSNVTDSGPGSGAGEYARVSHVDPEEDRITIEREKGTLQIYRELGTIERVSSEGDLGVRLDPGREVRFNIREHAHLDHGYAVTSHSFPVFAGGLATPQRIPGSQQVDGLARNNNLKFAD